MAMIGAALAFLAGPPGTAAAAINPIGPFTGQVAEGFEGFPASTFLSFDIFGGEAAITGVLGFGVGGAVAGANFATKTTPHGDGLFLNAQFATNWTFDQPVTHFGGWFATNIPDDQFRGPATAQFLAGDGTLLGTVDLDIPLGSHWVWRGWQATGAGFRSVVFTGPYVSPNAMLQFDDMQMGLVPEPSTYALLGTGLALLLVRLRRRAAA